MRVTVTGYNASWPQSYDFAAAELPPAFGTNLLETHHIGSTSVPGMHAKPIIDILAVVTELTGIDHRTAQMQAIGYEVMGEFGIPGRRYFRRNNSEGIRTHQIHAFQAGSPHILRHLAFRDFLRVHPVEAGLYTQLKQELAKAHPNDFEAYVDGKDGFIKEIQRRALIWSSSERRAGFIPPSVTEAG